MRNLGFFEKVDVEHQPGSAPDKTVITRSRWSSARPASCPSVPASRPRTGRSATSDLRSATCSARPGSAARLVASAPRAPADRSQLHRALFPRPRRSRPASTSSGPRTIASSRRLHRPSIGFALRAGWAYTEHTRQVVRYTLRQTDITTCSPGPRPSCRLKPAPRWSRKSPRRSPGIPAITRLNTTKGFLLRNTWRWPALIGTEQYSHHRRCGVLPEHHRGCRRSVGGSVGAGPLQRLIAPPEQPVLHRRQHLARLPGRRHRSARFDHRRRAGRHLLLHRHDRAQLPARPAQGDRHPRQGVRRCRLAVGSGRSGAVQQHRFSPATRCACRPASASNGYRHSVQSV